MNMNQESECSPIRKVWSLWRKSIGRSGGHEIDENWEGNGEIIIEEDITGPQKWRRTSVWLQCQQTLGEETCNEFARKYFFKHCFNFIFEEFLPGNGKEIESDSFPIINSFLSTNHSFKLPAGSRLLHNIYRINGSCEVQVLFRRIVERSAKQEVFIVSLYQGGPTGHFHILHDCSWRHRKCRCIPAGFKAISRNVYTRVPPGK